MNNKNQTSKIIKTFFMCVFICVFLMLVFMGFFKAHSNSEYALNGKKPEYVTASFFN